MFDTIWTSTLPPHEKSLERLGQEAFSILAAGGETTARAMARGLYHIAADDAILRRLQIEVDAAMPDGSIVPALAELEALPYLVRVASVKLSSRLTHRSGHASARHSAKPGPWPHAFH